MRPATIAGIFVCNGFHVCWDVSTSIERYTPHGVATMQSISILIQCTANTSLLHSFYSLCLILCLSIVHFFLV